MLEDGVMVGRIFQVKLAPEGKPWIWASVHNGDLGGAAHGYEAMLAGFADLFLLLVIPVPNVPPLILLISLAYSKRGVSSSWPFISRLWETDLRDINVAH